MQNIIPPNEPQSNSFHPIVTIVEEGIIRSTADFIRLNIVDWGRFDSHWESEQDAMDKISPFFVNLFSYTIAKVNFCEYPERDDFPQWEHVGDHVFIGGLFWNYFKYCFEGDLKFHDSPDFSGTIFHPNRTPQEWSFYGDIGKVSPIGIRESMESLLFPSALWFSVVDEDTLIVLERSFKLKRLPIVLQKQPTKKKGKKHFNIEILNQRGLEQPVLL